MDWNGRYCQTLTLKARFHEMGASHIPWKLGPFFVQLKVLLIFLVTVSHVKIPGFSTSPYCHFFLENVIFFPPFYILPASANSSETGGLVNEFPSFLLLPILNLIKFKIRELD